jgi:hypothetical protein
MDGGFRDGRQFGRGQHAYSYFNEFDIIAYCLLYSLDIAELNAYRIALCHHSHHNSSSLCLD